MAPIGNDAAPDWRRRATALFTVVCPDVDPACTLEITVLESVFKQIDNSERVKRAIREFIETGEFPPDEPFRPLYERLLK